MNEKQISQIDIDEALEILWTLQEEGKKDQASFKKKLIETPAEGSPDHRKRFRRGYRKRLSEEILNELEKQGYVRREGGKVNLTDKGHRAAREIVRRHRLAERLMVDLLDMGEEEVEKPACEFEHLLSEEVTNRICTLLGHPRECPHGMPIPMGECCEREKRTIEPVIEPLKKAPVGEKLKVAYINTKNHSRLHKLLSYDIGPGSIIELHQKEPVYVIKTGETDIALEEEVIKDIFVKPVSRT